MLVVSDRSVSTVENQGTSHSAGSIQIMFIRKGSERVSVGPSEQLLSRQNAMLQILMYSITTCMFMNKLVKHV